MPLSSSNAVARLLAKDADVEPAEFPLDVESCLIGRIAPCHIVVPRPTVSRVHARITRESVRYLLADAGSANGTFVNGRRIYAPHLLTDGDAIGLGAATAALHFIDPDPTLLSVTQLRYDERAMQFTLNARPLELTPSQFRLLLYLYQHAGAVCSREQCAEAIWGPDYAPGLDAEALDKVVSTIRGKLRQLGPATDLLVTRPGLGYALNP